MGETFLDRHGIKSGIKLNDVIEDFKYVYKGQEVKAGDFVNYINGVASKKDYGESVDTQLSDETYTGQVISAVALDENRVFIAHSNGSSQLLGNVVKIDGATITLDTSPTRLATIGTVTVISACLLPNGKVFIAHNGGSNYLYCVVVTIDGTTILGKTNKTINDSTTYTGATISTCVLRNGNVFIAHSYSTNYHLYGIVVTVSDTDIAFGTDTALVSSTNAGYTISTCLLPNGNVFIAHSIGTNRYLYGIVVSISGTTITKGSDTALNTDQYAVGKSISTLLPNGDVFISHSYGSDSLLYGIVISVNGTTISKGTDVHLGDGRYFTGYAISTCLLPNGDVFIAHNWDRYDYYLYGMIVSIDGTTITKKTDIALSDTTFQGQVISALLLPNGTIFIAHSNTENTYYLYAQIFGIDYENNIPTNHIVITEYEQQVTPAIEPPFDAVALSSGVGGTDTEHNEQVKIARLPIKVQVEKTFEGDLIPKTWASGTGSTSTQLTASNGVIVTASGYHKGWPLVQAFDGDYNTYNAISSTDAWVKVQFTEPEKVTKMYCGVLGNNELTAVKIEASNDNSNWNVLYQIKGAINSFTPEVTLTNPDYYQYYRIHGTLSGTVYGFCVAEWKTLEYIKTVTEVI